MTLDRADYQEKWEAWVDLVATTHHGKNHRVNPEAVLTPLRAPLAESTVALLTTAGAHVEGQPPFHVETIAGDATYRVIPDDVDLTTIRFSHTHYDTRSAEKDPNVVLPIDRLHEFVAAGRVGAASPIHLGMMGFNPDPTDIAEVAAPAVVGLFRDAGVDAVVLAPG
jgi:D-proline reductase (dithiol) PrdB